MAKLTNKQKTFVKEYVATDNGTAAALKAYEIQGQKPARVAAAIASENLTKPNIVNAILEALPDEDLAGKHKQLLGAVNLRRLEFDINDEDEVIEDVVARMPGFELLHIIRKLSKDGEVLYTYAYVKEPDNFTQDKALDKAYKIKGRYAAEKHAHLNVNMDLSTDPTAIDLDNLVKRVESELKDQKTNG